MIFENFDFTGWYDKDNDSEVESEDTLSILNRYEESLFKFKSGYD